MDLSGLRARTPSVFFALPPPVALEPIHPVAAAACRSSALIRPVCPTRVPAAFYPRSSIFMAPGKRLRTQYDVFNVEGFPPPGADRRADWRSHIVIYAGRRDLRSASGPLFDWPRRARPLGLRDGLTRVKRDRPRYLGRVRWSGRDGELVLARQYPNGGMIGNHVVFRWREHGIHYALALHEWEPFRQTLSTLRAILASLPRQRSQTP